MNKPQVPKSSSSDSRGTAAARAAAVATPQQLDSDRQLRNFESAMKLFHARKLEEARDLFRIAAEGPERDVAQRARLHIAMCDRRLEHKAAPKLETSEECYNYAIALLNTRDAATAISYLEKAVQLEPGADHIHYALALARAMRGDSHGAFESLKRAIELEPRNRIIARQDADFAHMAHQPPFDSLLSGEKKNW